MTPSTPVVVLQEKLISAKATALVLEAVDLPIEEKGKCTSAVCFCLTKLIDIATDQDDDGEVNQSNEYESDANNPASPWGNSKCCRKVDGKSVHQGPGSIFGEYCTGTGACLRIEVTCHSTPNAYPNAYPNPNLNPSPTPDQARPPSIRSTSYRSACSTCAEHLSSRQRLAHRLG